MTPEERAAQEAARLRELMAALGIDEALSRPAELDDDAMLARILAAPREVAPGTVPAATPARRLTRGRRLVRRAFAVAAVLLLGVLGVIQLISGQQAAMASTPPMLSYADSSPSDVIAGTAASARAVLKELAAAAASAPDVPRRGDTQRVMSSNWYLATTVTAEDESTSVIAPTGQTTWLRPDGSRRNAVARGAPLDVDGTLADEGAPVPGGPESVDDLPAGTFDAARAQDLPRDVDELRAALLEPLSLVPCDSSDEMAAACLSGEVVELFASYVVPSDLAAALWSMLAEEPAMASLGEVVDRAGRDGLAVAARPRVDDPSALVAVLIGDPETGQLLGTETIVLSSRELGIDEPTVTSFSAILSTAWVKDPGRRP